MIDLCDFRLLMMWTAAVTEFMQHCGDVVQSIMYPEKHPSLSQDDEDDDEKADKPREILYHALFMSFSKIFLLRPRLVQQNSEFIFVHEIMISLSSPN
jgi:hypothetical protein